MVSDLVYDVGMHNGSDTRHYLDSGFRVVAVEANPAFTAMGRTNFAEEIRDGRLVIVEAAIAPQAGEVTFWINDENDEWSSLIEQIGTRYGTRAHAINVNAVTFDRLLAEHGVPYYLKIDIENADAYCLRSLPVSDLPAYVSIEAHTAGYLGVLGALGYDDFKLIDQQTHLAVEGPPRPAMSRAHEARLAAERIARLVPGARAAYRALLGAAPSSRPEEPRTRSLGASGPFAEDTAGAWRSLDEVAFDYLRLRFEVPDNQAWYDFHARRSGHEP